MAAHENIKNHKVASFSTRAVRGGFWVLAFRIISKGLGFVRMIILARLLSPEDFGLLGIALLAIATLDTFSQTGLGYALIQKQENVNLYLDTAWTVSAIRGTFLFCILFFSASPIANFFNSTEAASVIRVMAICPLLSGFKNIGVVFFQKELEFNKQFIFQFSSTLIEFIVAIYLGFILRNVWALVWGVLAANLTIFLMSYILHSYRPRIRFEKEKFNDLFGFGKWVFGSSIVIFFAAQGDDAFLGKVLGVAAFGLYQMAFNLGNYPSSEITGVISKVAFPTYAKIQSSPQKLRDIYLRTIKVVLLFSMPLTVGIVLLAPELTKILLGEKWFPIIVPLQILALSGGLRSIAGTGGALFNAIGKPVLDFKMNLIRLIVIIISIYPLTMVWGISGTSISVLLGIIAACFSWFLASLAETKTNARDYLAISFPPLLATIFMSIIVFCVSKVLALHSNQLSVLLVSCFAGILSYFGIIYFLGKRSEYSGWQEIILILSKLKGC